MNTATRTTHTELCSARECVVSSLPELVLFHRFLINSTQKVQFPWESTPEPQAPEASSVTT